LIALGHLTIELCSGSLPVIYPVLIDTLGLNYTQVGTLALVSSMGTTLMQPLFGYLSDVWQPRWISASSIVWLGLMLGVIGLIQDYTLLAVVVGLGALGSAAFHPSGAIIAAGSAGTKRGVAVSIFSVGGTVGAALSPLLITAGMARLGTGATLLLMPIAVVSSLALGVWPGPVAPRAVAGEPAQQRAPARQNPIGLVLIVLSVMCLAWFQVSFKTYLPIWFQSRGRTLTVSGQMMFVFLAASGVGSLFGGPLSDRLGRWQLLVGCLGLLAPVTWAFVGASGLFQWLWVGVIGMLVGATFPVSIVIAQDAWPGGVGIASGLVMGLGWLPGGIGASITGSIADRRSLEVGLRWLVAPLLLGMVCMLVFATRRTSAKTASRPKGDVV